MDIKEIRSLRRESTWRLFGLTIITLSIYAAYYIFVQTPKIDKLNHGMKPIGKPFTELLLWLSVISAALTLFSLYHDTVVINLVDNLLSLAVSIMVLVWAFKSINRINAAFQINKQENRHCWFHAGWTLFFTTLYINYKINKISAMVDFSDRDRL